MKKTYIANLGSFHIWNGTAHVYINDNADYSHVNVRVRIDDGILYFQGDKRTFGKPIDSNYFRKKVTEDKLLEIRKVYIVSDEHITKHKSFWSRKQIIYIDVITYERVDRKHESFSTSVWISNLYEKHSSN